MLKTLYREFRYKRNAKRRQRRLQLFGNRHKHVVGGVRLMYNLKNTPLI